MKCQWNISETGAETLLRMSKAELGHNKAVRKSDNGHCTQDIKRAERRMADTDTPNITELKALTERLTKHLDEISDLTWPANRPFSQSETELLRTQFNKVELKELCCRLGNRPLNTTHVWPRRTAPKPDGTGWESILRREGNRSTRRKTLGIRMSSTETQPTYDPGPGHRAGRRGWWSLNHPDSPISLLDNKIINALDQEEEIIHETDEVLTFQDNILYWNPQITECLAGRQLAVSPLHYKNIAESKQQSEPTSTSRNCKSNHSTAIPWNG